MPQHSGNISNGTGSVVRTDINNALAAINSNNSGASDPSTMYAYQFYADTGDNTLKIRNAANNAYINLSVVGGIGLENFGLAPLTGATFTGDVILGNQSDLKLREATANGSNFIALQAPAAITSDVTLTLPAVAPTANQVLTADASTPTTLTWATPTVQATGATFTGDVVLDNQVDLRFEEATANGSNFIALQAPAAITSDVTLTLPAVAPTAGQVLQADSSTPTTLTWGSASGVGGATGVDFNDDIAIRFGGSNDGVIQYVSSTDAFTISTADGADIKLDSDDDLTIECDDDMNLISGDGIALKHGTSSSSELMIMCNDDSSVDLYFNGSKKLETVTGGIAVTGSVTASTPVAWYGEQDTQHNVSNNTWTNLANLGNNPVTTTGWSESTGVFTVPTGQAGAYMLTGGFGIDDVQTLDVIFGGFSVNDAAPTVYVRVRQYGGASNQIKGGTVSGIKYLNDGDTVSLQLRHNEGSTEPTEPPYCWFGGHRI